MEKILKMWKIMLKVLQKHVFLTVSAFFCTLYGIFFTPDLVLTYVDRHNIMVWHAASVPYMLG